MLGYRKRQELCHILRAETLSSWQLYGTNLQVWPIFSGRVKLCRGLARNYICRRGLDSVPESAPLRSEEENMLRGLLTLGGLLVGGLVAVAVASALLLPILGLVTALLVAAIKLAFFLAVVYFIVKLISPETADRALDKIRSKVRRAA